MIEIFCSLLKRKLGVEKWSTRSCASDLSMSWTSRDRMLHGIRPVSYCLETTPTQLSFTHRTVHTVFSTNICISTLDYVTGLNSMIVILKVVSNIHARTHTHTHMCRWFSSNPDPWHGTPNPDKKALRGRTPLHLKVNHVLYCAIFGVSLAKTRCFQD